MSKGTVAGFASHARVFALALHFGFIGVAGLARLVTCESDRSRPDIIQRARAEVPILAKIRRGDGLANQEEPHYSENQKKRDTA